MQSPLGDIDDVRRATLWSRWIACIVRCDLQELRSTYLCWQLNVLRTLIDARLPATRGNNVYDLVRPVTALTRWWLFLNYEVETERLAFLAVAERVDRYCVSPGPI